MYVMSLGDQNIDYDFEKAQERAVGT